MVVHKYILLTVLQGQLMVLNITLLEILNTLFGKKIGVIHINLSKLINYL